MGVPNSSFYGSCGLEAAVNMCLKLPDEACRLVCSKLGHRSLHKLFGVAFWVRDTPNKLWKAGSLVLLFLLPEIQQIRHPTSNFQQDPGVMERTSSSPGQEREGKWSSIMEKRNQGEVIEATLFLGAAW